jgi:hypothetical protein
MTSFNRRGAAAAAPVLALMLALGGCSAGSDGARHAPAAPLERREAVSAPSKETPSRNPPGDVDQTDATAMSRGALTALWSFDAGVDSRPHDAGVRAANEGWMTAQYAALLRAEQPQSVTGASWGEWVRHRARTDVTLTPAEDAAKPADTGTEAWRQWEVTATPHGRDGWVGVPTTVVAYVHLTRAAAGAAWRVAAVAVF